METVGQMRYPRLQLLNLRSAPEPGHRLRPQPPSLRLPPSRTAAAFRRFQSFRVAASSSSTSPPLPRRDPASLPDLLLAAAKPVLISLTAAAAVLLATPLQRRASSVAHAIAASPQPASIEKQQWGKGVATAAAAAAEEEERNIELRLRAFAEDKGALRDLLELRVRQNRLPDAVAVADRLVALDPGDSELRLLRAHILQYAGDTQACRAAFEEIIQKDPLMAGGYHGLMMLAVEAEERGAEGELKNVLERVEEALSRCREEGRAEDIRDFRMLLAQVKVMQEEYEGALQVYKELVEEEPEDFRPYMSLGLIYTMLGKEDEAEKHFELYRSLLPQGHPYAQYFDENMATLTAYREMQGRKSS